MSDTTVNDTPELEASIEIAAPADRVWSLVHDVRRMPEWSPTVSSTRLRAGFDEVTVGAEFTNLNSEGEFEWKTRGRIVRYEPEREMAFRVDDNWVVWSFRLEPAGSATRLVQRRETPEGISPKSLELTEAFMGGQEAFNAGLRAGMAETLERIKAAAEQ